MPFSVYCYDTENVMSCMHTFVPTIEYIEKFHDLLYQSVPQEERERFRGYLLKARVNSLHFLTIRGDVKWKRSLFFSDMKRHLGEIKLSFREEMLIRMPHIYKLIYMMYRYIK